MENKAILDQIPVKRTFEISGLLPGTTAAAKTNNYNAIQNAINAEGPKGPCDIVIPDGEWYVSDSIYSNFTKMQFIADAQRTKVSMTNDSALPVFVVGVKPTGLKDENFVADVKPIMDGTVTGIGVNIKNGCFIDVPFQRLSFPTPPVNDQIGWNLWDKQNAFTLEIAIDTGPTGLSGEGSICAISDGRNLFPLAIMYTARGYSFYFQTLDGTLHRFIYGKNPTGVVRIAFQVNLKEAKVSLFVNKQLVTDLVSNAGANFVPGNTLQFNTNYCCPLKIGGRGVQAGAQSDFNPNTADFKFTLLGFRLSGVERYSATKLPTTDQACFRNVTEADTFGVIPLNDSIESLKKVRQINVLNAPFGAYGVSRGCGFVLGDAQWYEHWITFCGTKNITFGRENPYGIVFGMGNAIGYSMEHTSCLGGACGFANITMGSNYVTDMITRNTFRGYLYAMYQYFGNVNSTGSLHIENFGVAAIYSRLSELVAEYLFVASSGQLAATKWFFNVGSMFIVNRLTIDNEGAAPTNLEAMLVSECDSTANTPMTIVDISHFYCAQMGPKASMFKLTNKSTVPEGQANGSISLKTAVMHFSKQPYKSFIDVGSSDWCGTIKLPRPPGVGPALTVSSPSGVSNISVEFYKKALT